MRLRHIAAALVCCLSLLSSGFGQTGISAALSGTVTDTSGALIPGVEVTATNTGTGVAGMAVTNESGTYRFPSLQPGPYEVKATLQGFQTQSFRLALGTAKQIRQNFTLQVGAVAGELGSLGLRPLYGPGKWDFDANL